MSDGHRQEHIGAVHVEGALAGEGKDVAGEARRAHEPGIDRGLGLPGRAVQEGVFLREGSKAVGALLHDGRAVHREAAGVVPLHQPASAVGPLGEPQGGGFQRLGGHRLCRKAALFAEGGSIVVHAPQPAHPGPDPHRHRRQPHQPPGQHPAAQLRAHRGRGHHQKPHPQRRAERFGQREGQRVHQGADGLPRSHGEGRRPVHGRPVLPQQQKKPLGGATCRQQDARRSVLGQPVPCPCDPFLHSCASLRSFSLFFIIPPCRGGTQRAEKII